MTQNDIQALYDQALQLQQDKQIDKAESAFLQVLELDPSHLDAITGLGSLYLGAGKPDEAISLMEPAASQHAAAVQLHLKLGNAYFEKNQLEDAERHYVTAVQAEPQNGFAWFSLAVARQFQGKLPGAVDAYKKSLELDQGHYPSYINIAQIFSSTGEPGNALVYLDAAVKLQPENPVGWNNLGSVCKDLAEHQRALAAFKKSFSLKNTSSMASNILLCMQYIDGISDADLFETARSFGNSFPESTQKASPGKKEKYRVGFVSGDLKLHVVGLFLLPVIEELKKSGHECYLYYNNSGFDEISVSLASFATWRNINELNDQQANQVIRDDNIDVLVDLSGHTAKNRLSLFALRPAPIQLSWLGYFATTGMSQIDAVLMDEWHVPPGFEKYFTERVVRLKHGRFCYTGPLADTVVVPPPSEKNGYLTFGSFNNTSKLNKNLIALWARVMNAVPDSRMILKWHTLGDSGFQARILGEFAEHGIEAGRIELRGHSNYHDLLQQYGDIDVALDTSPFSGGMTSCEALWMGVPVITLPGSRPVSRQTMAFLSLVGRKQWIASDEEDYVAIAKSLDGDRKALAAARASLREEISQSALADQAGFVQDFIGAIDHVIDGKPD